MDPNSLRFSPSHEWVHFASTAATIGISDVALRQLEGVEGIRLPEVGRKVGEGESFAALTSDGLVSELESPLAGEIIGVNRRLSEDVSLLKEDPYGAGWIVKLTVDDPARKDHLMNHDAYAEHCRCGDE